MTGNPSQPGWYPDPSARNTQRYWDGDAWTDQMAPLAPEAKGSRPKEQFLPTWGLVLGIVLVIMFFMVVWAVQSGEAEDRKLCQSLEEAYPTGDSC